MVVSGDEFAMNRCAFQTLFVGNQCYSLECVERLYETPDRRRSGTPPSAQNGLTGLYFGADLEGAQVTDGQLADTLSLQGAIMPDGSKHP
jgi:hypothetical protein